MYLTIEETAEYLNMPISQVTRYVLNGNIRSVHDGNEFLINSAQFELYFKQLEQMKQMMNEYWSEPLPPDRDIKDED
ncbi:MAG TPA: excisionase family DNA-binding protein [Savagea sp.]